MHCHSRRPQTNLMVNWEDACVAALQTCEYITYIEICMVGIAYTTLFGFDFKIRYFNY